MNAVYEALPPVGLILAAGLGKRLGTLTHDCPKCLVKVGGQTILSRALKSLKDCGIKEIIVVLGYRQEQVCHFLSDLDSSLYINTVVNQRFAETGTAVSLQMGLTFVPHQRDVVVIEGDVVFDTKILTRLLAVSPNSASVLAPYSPEIDIQGSFAICHNGSVLSLYHETTRPKGFSFEHAWKTVNLHLVGARDLQTTLLPALDTTLERWGSTVPLEYAIQFWVEGTGYPPLLAVNLVKERWVEVDTPSDLAEAERRFVCSR